MFRDSGLSHGKRRRRPGRRLTVVFASASAKAERVRLAWKIPVECLGKGRASTAGMADTSRVPRRRRHRVKTIVRGRRRVRRVGENKRAYSWRCNNLAIERQTPCSLVENMWRPSLVASAVSGKRPGAELRDVPSRARLPLLPTDPLRHRPRTGCHGNNSFSPRCAWCSAHRGAPG